MRPFRLKRPALIAGGLLVLGIVAMTLALWWPQGAPFDVLTPTKYSATPNDPMVITWSESDDVPTEHLSQFNVVQIPFQMPAKAGAFPLVRQSAEAQISNQWVKLGEVSLMGDDDDAAPLDRPRKRMFALLVPKKASACRVEIIYASYRSNLPFGIGNPFARLSFADAKSQRAQKFVSGISTALYDLLWPKEPHLKTATLEVDLTNLTTVVTVRDTPRSKLKL